MSYDFQAARQRVMELTSFYRRMMHIADPNGTWDWWLRKEIEELEAEIAEAKRKMAAEISSRENPFVNILSRWKSNNKEVSVIAKR